VGAWVLALLLWLVPFPASGITETFLEQHCYECHDADAKKGRLDLTALEFSAENTPVWIKIHDVVERGEMPPQKKRRPDPDAARTFLGALDSRLVAATSTAETGRIRMRRMTRREFENTLCDLLALPKLDVVEMLPADGRVAGYDKIAGGLDLSPGHLTAYQEAVEKALDAAIATRSAPPPVYRKRVYPAGLFKFGGNLIQGQYVLLKDKQPDPALPVRGGFEDKTGHVGHDGPDIEERRNLVKGPGVAQSQSAVGLLNPNLAGYEAALNVSPVYAGIYRLRISLWGFQWKEGRPVDCPNPQAAVLRAHEEGKQQEGGRLLRAFSAPPMQSEETEFTAYLNSHESIVFDPVSIPWNGLRIGQVAGRAAKHVGPGVALDWFEIEGPLHQSWPPESHRRLFGVLPIRPLPAGDDSIPPRREVVRSLTGYLPNLQRDFPPNERAPALETVQSEQPEEDGRRLLGAFLPRAFRREVGPGEAEPYVSLLKARLLAKDCFEDAMRRVYVAILTSPEFLFQPADTKDGRGLFGDKAGFTLASRLSYWLWNGPPDEELLEKARDETLLRPAVLRGQIDRLLTDPRSGRFIEDFTDQWLELNRLEETTPDPQLYPEYRFLLHEGMAAESRAFIRNLLEEDLPIGSLLQPGFAMLTQRLAEHYGVAGVPGVEVRKVPLQAHENFRGGLLGQAAIHKLTANGTTTSPVKRGVWVMDRLLNSPAPPPPPGISQIDPDTRGTTTVREQLDRHRNDANCAACHARIDPPGFALESFDPIGGLRERYRSNGAGDEPPEKGKTPWRVQYKLGPKVDASGALSDGRAFEHVAALNRLLLSDQQRLAEAFVAHLSRYATGMDVGYADRAEIRHIVESTRSGGYRMRSLLHALGASRLLFPEPSHIR
jgi:mono/diheme cytochrome c family protein